MRRLQQASLLTIGILSLVEGTRSIADITEILTANSPADPGAVRAQVLEFFRKVEAG